jgi:hypothetical protein
MPKKEEAVGAALERPNHRGLPPLCRSGVTVAALPKPLTTTIGRQGARLQNSTTRNQSRNTLHFSPSAATTAGQKKESRLKAPPRLPSPPWPAEEERVSKLVHGAALLPETTDLHSIDAFPPPSPPASPMGVASGQAGEHGRLLRNCGRRERERREGRKCSRYLDSSCIIIYEKKSYTEFKNRVCKSAFHSSTR